MKTLLLTCAGLLLLHAALGRPAASPSVAPGAGHGAALQDTLFGYAYFPFGLSCFIPHEASHGVHLNVHMGEFYRIGVSCVADNSRFASRDWPATGQIGLDAYNVFYVTPAPGTNLLLSPNSSLAFNAQRYGKDLDSLEVRIVFGHEHYVSLLKVKLEDEEVHAYAAPLPYLTTSDIFSVRFYAWSAQAKPGGKSSGILLLEDVLLPFSVDLRTAVEAPYTPASFALSPAYPNPFQTATRLTLTLEQPQPVRLEVYNVLGQQVRLLADGMMPAGAHPMTLEAEALPRGVYLVRAVTGGTAITRLVTLAR